MSEQARRCRECQYYVPTHRASDGVCDRVGNPDFCYSVSAEMGKCLFGNQGYRISGEEVKRRQHEAVERHAAFLASGKRASEIVAGWPEWKRNLLG